MKFINKCALIIWLGIFAGCSYDFPESPVDEPRAGEADFSKYVAVGNSLTAGYMDGALYNRGQQNSFAVMLSEQFKLVGGGDFQVPGINSQFGFYTMGPNGPLGRLILTINPQDGSIAPAPIGPGELPTPYSGDKTSLNNFGVPGITLGSVLTPLTGGPASDQNPAYNPLYARFASVPGESTIIGDAATALANGGTFFSFWLGSGDVLGYAVGGAANPELLTSSADFEARLAIALNTMLQANEAAHGVVLNIPNLNVLPYFNLVPWNALPLSAEDAEQANHGYAVYNGGLAQAATLGLISNEEKEYRTIYFEAGQNGFVMEDESLTDLSALGIPSIRQSKAQDRATLTLAQALGQPSAQHPNGKRGVTFPVEDRFVLIPDEQEEIQDRINTFNAHINTAVTAHSNRLGLVDVKTLLDQIADPSININAGGVGLNAGIAPPNGGFSVDGIHPNGRAHAFITNLVIQRINEKWNANIPQVNPNAFVGNDLPVSPN